MSMSSIITSPAVQGVSMSSREIAKLCDKRHDHVLRDTMHMLSELEIDAPKFGLVTFTFRSLNSLCGLSLKCQGAFAAE
jgi:phage regulator Rha-like protein